MLCGGLCTQVGLELSPGFVCACVQGRGLGQQGLEPSNIGKELKKERTRQVGVQVCAQMCVLVVEET